MNYNKILYRGLSPWTGRNPKILILGTIPSLESFNNKKYYINTSNNSFWEIMSHLFCENLTPDSKIQLTNKGIALWDCLSECYKQNKNNSDNAIIRSSAHPVDLEDFLKKHPTIKYIFLNGFGKRKGTLYWFEKFFKNLNQKYITLPNTSNSYARISKIEKISEWRHLLDYLR